jgi:predicted transcriptional regulator
VTLGGAVLLSIKPRFAEALLAGQKTIELRRTRPASLHRGALVVVYASSPVKAVLGTLRVERVVGGSPEALWPLVAAGAGVDRAEYEQYFAGASEAYAIFVCSPASVSDPCGLAELRQGWPSFHPPQAFRYLRNMGTWAWTLLERLGVAQDEQRVGGPADSMLPEVGTLIRGAVPG